MTDTITIDGNKYRVRINQDAECPISITRLYQTGERRTVNMFGTKVTQIKQADGSWWNIQVSR